MTILSGLAGRAAPRLSVPSIRTSNIVLLLLLTGLGVTSFFALRTTPQAATVTPRTATVSRGVVLSSVSASGSVAAPKDLAVGFETAGQVAGIDVKPGQHVAKGQTLATLDQTDAQASVAQAQATLASAKANLLQTQTGETAAQRAADAAALAQTRVQVTTAETAVRNADAQLAADRSTTRQAVTSAQSTLGLRQADAQLRADQGNEKAAVAKLAADKAKLTVGGTTYATSDQAVNAWTAIVDQDKQGQQAATQANFDLQSQQTLDQQQLNADQTSLGRAVSKSDKSYWQGRVDSDQAQLNQDAQKVQAQAKTLNQLQYQLTQDEAQLQTLQALQTTLTQDQSSIAGYEAKLVTDRNQIATATSARNGQIQTAQASRAATLAKDQQSILAARQQVTSAKLSLTTAQANGTVKTEISPATLAQSQAQVVQAEAGLAAAERTLSETVLRAPAAATVAKVNGVVGQSAGASGTSSISAAASTSSTGSTGSTASSGTSGIVELVDLGGLQVTASFSESDAAKVQLGQAGTVTVSALPGKELAAHVIAIDVAGTTSSGVVQYSVTLALDRTVAGLKPGMSANATVTTSERDNVLDVPNAAVTGTGQNATVTVVDANGRQHQVNVVAGLKGDSVTEISSGLTAGERVVTSSGVVATSSTGTSTSTPFGGRGLGGGGFGGLGAARGG